MKDGKYIDQLSDHSSDRRTLHHEIYETDSMKRTYNTAYHSFSWAGRRKTV